MVCTAVTPIQHHKFGRHQVNLLLIKILSKMLRTTEREAALQLMELEEAEVESVVIEYPGMNIVYLYIVLVV